MTPRVAASLRRRIKCAPTKSLRQVAAEAGQNREVVRRLVKLSSWRSLRRTKVPLVSEDGQKNVKIKPGASSIASKRAASQAKSSSVRTKRTSLWIPPSTLKTTGISASMKKAKKKTKTKQKTKPAAAETSSFQQENMLLDPSNPQAPCFWGPWLQLERYSPLSGSPQAKFRLDSEAYIKALRETLIPWMRRVAAARGNVAFLWQQGSAPAHRTKKTLAFLNEMNIPFWMPEQWLPNSPDLNPSYGIWSMVQQGACKDRPPSVAALKK